MATIKGCNLPYGIMVFQVRRDGRLREKICIEDEAKILGQFSVRHLGFVKGFDVFEYSAMANALLTLLDVYRACGFHDCLMSFKRTEKPSFLRASRPNTAPRDGLSPESLCPRAQHTA